MFFLLQLIYKPQREDMKKKFFYVGPRGGMPYITYAAYDFFLFSFKKLAIPPQGNEKNLNFHFLNLK
jgi:hypothetical protein